MTVSHVQLMLDGQPMRVEAGVSVAAALRRASDGSTRLSVTGQARAPLCGMGVCQECRVDVDGRRVLACQTLCREGTRVTTGLHAPRQPAPPDR